MCPNGKTALTNRLEFDAKKRYLEQEHNMEVEVHWECEVRDELKHNEEMRRFFDSCHDTGPLNPKDAYFGGRTGPCSLKCDLEEEVELAEGYEIRCLDIVSLYPYINFVTDYPVGHGEPLELNRDVLWTHPEHNRYKGLIKCFIVPPEDLLLPVVPYHINGKLMFPLCHACAKDSERRSRRMPRSALETPTEVMCPHRSAERRGFVTTLSHLELEFALSRGYQVHRVYSAVVWSRWSSSLFRPYIADFMRIKVEASGWPEECRDNDQLKQAYIDKYFELFDIRIDASSVENNPGLKYIAKM